MDANTQKPDYLTNIDRPFPRVYIVFDYYHIANAVHEMSTAHHMERSDLSQRGRIK